nr:RHS repeat-associated core domain-containing protein [Kangiella shandongensis]
MNGRAYDYNLGRFLSVDPFIQSPGNSQSMNPYSYIMNNPLAGTDPSGYVACDDAGNNCDLGNMSMDEVDNITVNDDGSIHVNTTDGNTYQVDSVSSTSNGVQTSMSFNQGSGWSGKIEEIGSPSSINTPNIEDHSNSAFASLPAGQNAAYGGGGDNYDDFEGSPDNQVSFGGTDDKSSSKFNNPNYPPLKKGSASDRGPRPPGMVVGPNGWWQMEKAALTEAMRGPSATKDQIPVASNTPGCMSMCVAIAILTDSVDGMSQDIENMAGNLERVREVLEEHPRMSPVMKKLGIYGKGVNVGVNLWHIDTVKTACNLTCSEDPITGTYRYDEND